MLYWVEINRNGFQPDYLKYLRLSYQLGPNEGWIALKRNGYALAIFRRLPPDLAQMVIAEFANLLNSGFDDAVVKIFEGPGWSQRALLLPQLKGVAEIHREAFAKALYRAGYDVTCTGHHAARSASVGLTNSGQCSICGILKEILFDRSSAEVSRMLNGIDARVK